MPVENYEVVACEGGDQVGKADAFLTFSKKISEMGISQTYSSFPIYASPFGGTIRMFLREGLSELELSPVAELKAKMAVYALDRLQFMDVLLSNDEYNDSLIVLDRSCFSNAVTIAYGLANLEGITQEEIDDLIAYALSLEKFMIDKLNLKNSVVQIVSLDDGWGNVRNESRDINENSDVQTATGIIYDKYQQIVGDGWCKVVTRTKDGWRSREDIFADIFNFVEQRNENLKRNGNGMGKYRNINIREILKIYEGAQVDKEDIETYLNAILSNDKETMHEYGIKVCTQISSTFKKLNFRNKEVGMAFKGIIANVPEVLNITEKFLGKEFNKKVVDSLNLNE